MRVIRDDSRMSALFIFVLVQLLLGGEGIKRLMVTRTHGRGGWIFRYKSYVVMSCWLLCCIFFIHLSWRGLRGGGKLYVEYIHV